MIPKAFGRSTLPKIPAKQDVKILKNGLNKSFSEFFSLFNCSILNFTAQEVVEGSRSRKFPAKQDVKIFKKGIEQKFFRILFSI